MGMLRFDALGTPAGGLALAGGRLLVARAVVADHFAARLVGMLGTPDPGPDEALVLASCNWVHGVGLRATICAVFVDRRGLVLRVVDPLPARGARCARAHAVIEAASGALPVARGQRVHLTGHALFPHDGHFASRAGGSDGTPRALSGHRGHGAPADDRRF